MFEQAAIVYRERGWWFAEVKGEKLKVSGQNPFHEELCVGRDENKQVVVNIVKTEAGYRQAEFVRFM